MRAIVIGAGIGGLTAAIGLRRLGLEVQVHERSDALERVGAGLTLWANALRALDELGLARAVLDRGTPLGEGEVRTRTGRLLAKAPMDAVARRHGVTSVGIHRGDLQDLLLAAADGVTLDLGATCSEVGQDRDGVFVRFTDGREARGDLLIGADGIHSQVRRSLMGTVAPRYAGYTAWRGVAPGPVMAEASGASVELWGRGERFGIVPLRGETYWFAVANRSAGEPKQDPEVEKRALHATFGSWARPVSDLIQDTPGPSILRGDVHDLPPLDRWTQGAIALLGDAAHAMTPNLGQGACQAIEDAVVLARAVERNGDMEAALRAYQDQRLMRARRVAALSRRLGRVAQWEHPFACRLRDRLLAWTPQRVQMRPLSWLYRFPD